MPRSEATQGSRPVDLPGRIAQGIRVAREHHGWTVRELAARTGVSAAYVNRLERGEVIRPGADVVRRLEDVIGPLAAPPQRSAARPGPASRRERRAAGPTPSVLPEGLRQLAEEQGLSAADVVELSALRFNGRQPRTIERWRAVHEALAATEELDG